MQQVAGPIRYHCSIVICPCCWFFLFYIFIAQWCHVIFFLFILIFSLILVHFIEPRPGGQDPDLDNLNANVWLVLSPPYFILMITLITATVCLPSVEKIHVIFQANTEPKSFLEPLKELLTTFMELPCLEFDWQVLMISKGGFFELGRFSVERLRSCCISMSTYRVE